MTLFRSYRVNNKILFILYLKKIVFYFTEIITNYSKNFKSSFSKSKKNKKKIRWRFIDCKLSFTWIPGLTTYLGSVSWLVEKHESNWPMTLIDLFVWPMAWLDLSVWQMGWLDVSNWPMRSFINLVWSDSPANRISIPNNRFAIKRKFCAMETKIILDK